MTKIQNSKRLGHWILEFGISLEFRAWDLRFLNTSIPRDIKDYLSIDYSTVKFHTRIWGLPTLSIFYRNLVR
jgi:hypothetical protein